MKLNSYISILSLTLLTSHLPVKAKAAFDDRIFIAAEENNLALVTNLLEEDDFDPNQTDSQRRTALFIAAQCNSEDVARFLLQSGADPNKANADGATALHIAAQQNSKEVAALLIKSGPRLNGEVADILSSYVGTDISQWMIQFIMTTKADLNQGGKWEQTPLYVAAQNNSKDVAELLLQAGAHVNQAKNNGCIPLHIAALNNSTDVVCHEVGNIECVFYMSCDRWRFGPP